MDSTIESTNLITKNKAHRAKREVNIMTIKIHDKATIEAKGTHTQSNHKPVYCITTNDPYVSLYDAAKAIGVNPGTLSHALTRKRPCKGLKFCFVKDLAEHFDEIVTQHRADKEKAIAYDAIKARENAVRQAEEDLIKHRKNCERLRRELEQETAMIAAKQHIIDTRGAVVC